MDYLEVVVDPALNLPEVSRITKTPVQIVDITDGNTDDRSVSLDEKLHPVSCTLHTSVEGRYTGLSDIRTSTCCCGRWISRK